MGLDLYKLMVADSKDIKLLPIGRRYSMQRHTQIRLNKWKNSLDKTSRVKLLVNASYNCS